jgi:hypothetical protein
MAKNQFMIGADFEGMSFLFTLSITSPLYNFKPYSNADDLGDSSVKGSGWPIAEWYWAYLSEDERDALKTFCPNLSKEVYIRTLNDHLEWTNYRVMMIWPVEAEDRQVGSSMKFQLIFRVLEELA